MTRQLLPVFLLALALVGRGEAAGGDPSDPAVRAVRDLIAVQCPCAEAASARAHFKCADAVVTQAIAQNRLTRQQRSTVLKCVKASTCGRPGAVACCRTTASGRVKCSVKKDAASCRAPDGGSACVRTVASCCDSCAADGTCPSASTTTTTLPGAVCGNGVRESGEQCDTDDFGTATCPGSSVVGAFLECTTGCTIDASGCPGQTTTTTLRPGTSTTVTVPPTTTTVTTSSTTTTLPDVGCSDPILRLPPLVKLPIDLVAGSSSCGGPNLNPGPTSPFAGQVQDGSGHRLANLGTGCLYVGGGTAPLAPVSLTPGSQMVVNVVGLRGTKAIAGPSDGTGPRDCTRGAGPGRHCLNGAPGRDGQGRCSTDVDCGGPGTCALDANCFFGSPISLTAPLAACVVNTVLKDFCAEANLFGFAMDVRGALGSRVYLGACPTCQAGKCVGGARNGLSCKAAPDGSSTDCLPAPAGFVGAFASVQSLSTEQRNLSNATGQLCTGQSSPGAFGLPAARRVQTDGERLSLFTLQTTLAGPFCALPSGNPLLDVTAGLPAPAAVSIKGRVDLLSLIRLFGL